ncbi:MAG: hypothetical protein ABI896_10260 [Actinomycetota bacterium]
MKLEPGTLPKRPYRDAALLYAGFALVFVIIVWVTGGHLLPRAPDWRNLDIVIGAIPLAIGCFLIATAYSWWRIRKRLEAEEDEA